ncbi:MAG: sigma-70 family RNA polymerase sigma factor [Chitinophagaceae bacterium]|nr:sigma-70 family RNA polymerase sigma factor [Anaerolineae bacterium]
MTSPEIHQTIRRAQQGDDAAITSLYERFAPLIYRYIYYRVSSTADAEDLTTEVFIKMVEALPRYKLTGAPFEAWLYRIAFARVVDFRRRAERRPLADLSDEMADSKPNPEEQVSRRLEVEALRKALRQLTDEQQHILILRFIEQKSHQEVAEVLGKSMTAVKSAQHRALIQLVAALGSEEKVRHYLRGGGDD